MPAGRPKKEIDFELVERLAHIHCTQEEIADILDISVRTLQRNKEFCRVYKKGMNVGRMSLRRKQFKAAEGGNTTMLIWLGKQYLGQKEDAEKNELQRQELELKRRMAGLDDDEEEVSVDAWVDSLKAELPNIYPDNGVDEDDDTEE